MGKRASAPVEVTPPRELEAEQLRVIAELLTGVTDEAAAAAAGVSARSVSRWRRGDALFVATLNAERAALWDAQRDRLRSMLAEAVAVVEADLRSDDEEVKRAAARALLRQFGRELTLAPSGPTDERQVRSDWMYNDVMMNVMGL